MKSKKLLAAFAGLTILTSCTMGHSNSQKGTASFVFLGTDAQSVQSTPTGIAMSGVSNSQSFKVGAIAGVTAYGLGVIGDAVNYANKTSAAVSNAKTTAGVANTATKAGVSKTAINAKAATEALNIKSKTLLGLKALDAAPIVP